MGDFVVMTTLLAADDAHDTPRAKVRKKTKETAPVDKDRICSFVKKAFCKILSGRPVSVSDIPTLFKQKYVLNLAQALESCGFNDAEAYLREGEDFNVYEQDGMQMASLALEDVKSLTVKASIAADPSIAILPTVPEAPRVDTPVVKKSGLPAAAVAKSVPANISAVKPACVPSKPSPAMPTVKPDSPTAKQGSTSPAKADSPSLAAKPGLATPAKPGLTTPAKPGLTTPAKPGLTTPAKPGLTTPAKPGLTTPAKQELTTPAKLGSPTPEKPSSPAGKAGSPTGPAGKAGSPTAPAKASSPVAAAGKAGTPVVKAEIPVAATSVKPGTPVGAESISATRPSNKPSLSESSVAKEVMESSKEKRTRQRCLPNDRFPSKASGTRPLGIASQAKDESSVAPAVSKAPSGPKVGSTSSQPAKDPREPSPSTKSVDKKRPALLREEKPSKKPALQREEKSKAPTEEVLRILRERGVASFAFSWELNQVDGNFVATSTLDGKKVHGEPRPDQRQARESCGEAMLEILKAAKPLPHSERKRRKTAPLSVVEVQDWVRTGQLLDEIEMAEFIGLGFDTSTFSIACGTKQYNLNMKDDFPRSMHMAIISAIVQAAACRNPTDGTKRTTTRVGGRWRAHTLPHLLRSPVGQYLREITVLYALAQASLQFEETNADAWPSLSVMMDNKG